jgi:hypothetical protein
VKSLSDIDPNKMYFLVYVREKTEEEIEEEENVSEFKSVLTKFKKSKKKDQLVQLQGILPERKLLL